MSHPNFIPWNPALPLTSQDAPHGLRLLTMLRLILDIPWATQNGSTLRPKAVNHPRKGGGVIPVGRRRREKGGNPVARIPGDKSMEIGNSSCNASRNVSANK